LIYSKMTMHAIAALSELARHPAGKRIATARIADAASVSRPMLTKVIAELERSGFVRTREGRNGGVRLSDQAASSSLRQVADTFDRQVGLPECPFHPDGCSCGEDKKDPCRAHALWVAARAAFDRFLDEVTIADVSESRPE